MERPVHAPKREYLIRRTDGEWFDLDHTRFAEVLRPTSLPSKPVPGWGDHRIRVKGFEVSFSYEDPGIQVVFEGSMSEEDADRITQEVLANIVQATGQQGKVIPL